MAHRVALLPTSLLMMTAAIAAAQSTSPDRQARMSSPEAHVPCTVGMSVDDTGIVDWDYQNPRNPPYVFGELVNAKKLPTGVAALTPEEQLLRVLMFALTGRLEPHDLPSRPACNGHLNLSISNRSTSQDVLVKIDIPKLAFGCPEKWTASGQVCKWSDRVPAVGSSAVQLDLWAVTEAIVLSSPQLDVVWWREIMKETEPPATANPIAETLRELIENQPPDTLVSIPNDARSAIPAEPGRAAETTTRSVRELGQLDEGKYDKLSPTIRQSTEQAVKTSIAQSTSIPVMLAEARKRFANLSGPAWNDLRDKVRSVNTAISVVLAPITRPAVVVNVEFYASADPPPNTPGYFRVWPGLEEPPSSSALKTKIETTWSRDVNLPKDAVFLTPSTRYDGSDLRHMTGLGTLTVGQTLGNRAKASVTLKFRGGDLGIASDPTVTTSQYQLDVFNSRHVTASVGRFQFSSPTDGIAISETGDGARLRFRELSLARRAKRESVGGIADKLNQDDTAWIATIDNISTPFLGFVKSFSLIGLRGRDSSPAVIEVPDKEDKPCGVPANPCPHSYETLGGSVNFSGGKSGIGGSLGIYHSRRFEVEGIPEGRGWVGQVTLSMTRGSRVDPSKPFVVTSVLGTALGYGTGDDPSTPQDEGYIGETASLPADSAFIGSIAGRVKLVDDGAAIPRGLSNKFYWRVSWESRSFSLLEPLARLLGALDVDIKSKSFKLVGNYYRFNEPVQDSRGLGVELLASTDIATPPGVTVGVAGTYFIPNGSVDPIFVEHEPWRLVAKLSVSLP